jgi:hypothetical protein
MPWDGHIGTLFQGDAEITVLMLPGCHQCEAADIMNIRLGGPRSLAAGSLINECSGAVPRERSQPWKNAPAVRA